MNLRLEVRAQGLSLEKEFMVSFWFLSGIIIYLVFVHLGTILSHLLTFSTKLIHN